MGWLLKKNSMSKIKEDGFVLKPNKSENRGKYLSRCSSNSKMKEQFPNMKERLGSCLNAFNAYYRYWSKLEEFSTDELPMEMCMADNRARGMDYKKSYAMCMKKQEDGELLVEPVMFEDTNIGDCIKKRMIDDSSLTEEEARKRCSASVVVEPQGGTNPQVVTMETDEFYDITYAEEKGLEDVCWPGYEAIGLKDNGDPNCVPVKMTEDDFAESISDYPEGVKNAAKKAVDYAEKNGWGSCGTQVGKTRASQLAGGEPISVDTIKRMYSYLSRHKSDLTSSKSYEEGCGRLMYDSWGGEPALTWSERKLRELEGK